MTTSDSRGVLGLVCQEVRLRTPAQGLPEFSLFGGDRLPPPTRIAVQASETRNGPIVAPNMGLVFQE